MKRLLQSMTSRGMGVFLSILIITAGVIGCSKSESAGGGAAPTPCTTCNPAAQPASFTTAPTAPTAWYNFTGTVTFKATHVQKAELLSLPDSSIAATAFTSVTDSYALVIPASTGSRSWTIRLRGDDNSFVYQSFNSDVYSKFLTTFAKDGIKLKQSYSVTTLTIPPYTVFTHTLAPDTTIFTVNKSGIYYLTNNGGKYLEQTMSDGTVKLWLDRSDPTIYWTISPTDYSSTSGILNMYSVHGNQIDNDRYAIVQ